MRPLVRFVLAAALLGRSAPPHWPAGRRCSRIAPNMRCGSGAAANAPRIGTAVQDLTQDCAGWHLKRDIKTEIALTPSWKMTSPPSSMPKSAQRQRLPLSAPLQVQNGSEREITGRVQREGGELRAEIVLAGGPPNQFVLPPPTLMPVAAIDHLIERLQANAATFPALTSTPK